MKRLSIFNLKRSGQFKKGVNSRRGYGETERREMTQPFQGRWAARMLPRVGPLFLPQIARKVRDFLARAEMRLRKAFGKSGPTLGWRTQSLWDWGCRIGQRLVVAGVLFPVGRARCP